MPTLRPLFATLVVLVLGLARPQAQAPGPLDAPAPDDRFKVDLLLIVAHPDDDALAGSYLAKAVLDEGRKVAVVFATRGDAGGNQVGTERAASLGLVREMEARRDLATLGVTNVWFLQGRDTPSQNPLVSLANWDHGRTLGEAVRLVRLTRPEVILTWLPTAVVGENHGDHQAASVVATEAFDLAGDATAFSSQVAASSGQFEPRLENLRPWQPKKLYFMSDANDTSFMEGHGPSYSIKAISSARKAPYWQLVFEQLHAHRTQFAREYDQLAAADPVTRERLITANPDGEGLIDPLRLVRGTSHVGGAVTGDVFEGITSAPVPFVAAPGYRPAAGDRVTMTLGSQWHFYRQFWPAHGLSELPALDHPAIGPVGVGQAVRIPLRLANPTTMPVTVTVTTQLPQGWTERARASAVRLPPGGEYELESIVTTASAGVAGAAEIRYDAATNVPIATVSVRVVVRPTVSGLPQ